jgi:hypothetical protein
LFSADDWESSVSWRDPLQIQARRLHSGAADGGSGGSRKTGNGVKSETKQKEASNGAGPAEHTPLMRH